MRKIKYLLFIFIFMLLIAGCDLFSNKAKTVVVHFVVDDNETLVVVDYNTKVEKPSDPTPEAGYRFVGWYLDDELFNFDVPVKENIYLYAEFEEIVYCKITFKDSDGSIISTNYNVIKGTTIDYFEPNQTSMKFVGWYFGDELFDFTQPIRQDMILVAGYEPYGADDVYTVSFLDKTGNVVKIEKVKYGESATPPVLDEIEGFTFEGWDGIYENVYRDAVITPIYEAGVLNVVFKNYDGTVLSTQNIGYSSDAIPPYNPVRTGYEFVGWDKPYTNITKNTVITAVFKIKTFSVTFKDYNGSTLKEMTVQYNQNALPPADPKRTGYVFQGWDKSYNEVTSNLVITAIYLPSGSYSIKYNLNGGSFSYKNKAEYTLDFLKDFYSFLNPTETLREFIYGESNDAYLGTWPLYIGEGNQPTRLIYNNDLTADNNDYFLNSYKYKAKWASIGDWVKQINGRFGGTSEYGGMKDFYRYVLDDPQGYASVYGEKFNQFPELNPVTLYSYVESNQDIVLPKPISSNFAGWYLNSDFTGDSVDVIKAHSKGNLELYARWSEEITYEIYFNCNGGDAISPITVRYNQDVVLPIPYKYGGAFIGWKLNDVLIENNFKFNFKDSITLEAEWEENLVSLKYDNNALTYRNSSTEILIPSKYVAKTEEFRAAWVTSLVGDFSPSTNKEIMKQNLTEVLDILDSYNMNAIVFHVRIMNDALYKTHLAPINSSYGTYSSFETWDYLTWFISECHKRNIEFHAWLNPYRIKTNGYSLSTTPADVANEYVDYPLNPASKAENILMTYTGGGAEHGAILNPAKKEVRDYIVDVCLELMQNYDIDAIHFDDYFYAQMSAGIDVINEADQNDYLEYISSHPEKGYRTSNVNDKKQWRRDNVDAFIFQLHEAMTNFNIVNNRAVQLGIAPTGIYRNGNGTVNSGSNTGGQEHYSSYLFCDTKKWVQEEWIDYIIPQSYWSFGQNVASYAAVVDWWNEVVKPTRVNLYTGMGIYMTGYTWGSQKYEASNQVLYNTKYSTVKGTCIFSFKWLSQIENNSSDIRHDGLMRIKNEYWTTKVPTPKTMASQYKNNN